MPVKLTTGDTPGYFAPLIPEGSVRGFPELLIVAQFEPPPRASVERAGVGISELDLNMLVVGFDRSGTNPERFRDTARSEAGTNQPKDVQLAVSQITGVAICGRIFYQLVNRDQRYPRADVKLTCDDGLDGMDQTLRTCRSSSNSRRPGAERAFCVNLFRLSRSGLSFSL